MTSRKTIGVEDYVNAVKTSSKEARKKGGWGEKIISGLIGEFGSVVSVFKKNLRPEEGYRLTPYAIKALEEELGDLLWYLVALSNKHRFDFGKDILVGGLSKLPTRFEEGHEEESHIRLENLDTRAKNRFKKDLKKKKRAIAKDFDAYQRMAVSTRLTEDTVQLTKVCISEISRFVARLTRISLEPTVHKSLYKIGPVDTRSCIQDIMWSVSNIADIQGLPLGALAQRNVEKTRELFPPKRVWSNLTKKEVKIPEHQEFPKKFDVQIIDVGKSNDTGKSKSRMYRNGRRLGNDVNDNTYIEDGYRFHDVLHLSFVAYFGWSPVIRGFMKRKRKVDPKIDENEDGARAILVDELVINLMHTEADRLKTLRSSDENEPLFPEDERFSSEFGSWLRHLVRGLEVRNFKHWEWEKVAHRAFAIYDDLRRHHEGTLTIDRTKKTIEFSKDLKFDLNGVLIRQIVDTRKAANNAGREALMAATHAVSCPDLKLKDVASEIKIHDMGNGQFIAQLRGNARDAAREQKILTVKLTQAKSGQLITTIATALGDLVDFA